MLPSEFSDELAFYRVVNWGYVVVNEAAKIPLAFLTQLPPLRADGSLPKDLGYLRTYVAHNLDVSSSHDLRTLAFTHRWFRNACGAGTPRQPTQFAACCEVLAAALDNALQGAISACDSLDSSVDGPRLVADLKSRIDLRWDAHRFDPIVEECARRLGNPGLDLLLIRKRNLDAWRQVVATSDEHERERALLLRIEGTLLKEIGEALPVTVQEASKRLGIAGINATIAALLLLRDARRFAAAPLPEIIEQVSATACSRADTE
jgi:hypothetical protein